MNWPWAPPTHCHLRSFTCGEFSIDSQLLVGGNGDSQLWTLDSQLGSQLLAGKQLKWRSLNRDRHSHRCCLSLINAPTPSFSPARLTSCTSAAVAVATPITLSTSSPHHFHAPVMWLTLFPFIDATCNNNPLTNMNTMPTGVL